MTINLYQLNDQQRLAAQQIDGPVLILAGAGSGKTRTITYRMAHMVCNLNIAPERILAVSFTNKAAMEMKERMVGLLGTKRIKGITLSTFHSLGNQILRQELGLLGQPSQFTIYDSGDQMSVVREALRHIKSDKAFDRKRIMAKISFLKNKGLSPQEFPASPFFHPDEPYDVITEAVYHHYQEKLKFCNAIDFDDLLFLPVKIFRQFPEVAEKWSRRYQYLMIDEYQDTNPLQFQIVLALTKTHHNICVVGDDDQSIYGFRGADISNILQFEKLFPNTQVIKLEENYRSTPGILKLANVIIREVHGRKDKTMWTKNTDEEMPQLWACGDGDHEAQVVAEEIKKLHSQGKRLDQIGVLYRSNTQTPPLEDALRMNNIPYAMIGGQKFYEKKEVKDLIAYLSLINNPHDDLSLRRVLNTPSRGIGPVTLGKYLEVATSHRLPLLRAMEAYPGLDPQREKTILEFTQLVYRSRLNFKDSPLPVAMEKLVEDLQFNSFIDKSYDNPHQQARRKNDVQQFIQGSARFLRYHQGEGSLQGFLERVLLQDSQDKADSPIEDENGNQITQVTLMTLHSSKGLEFDIVFLVGMEEELLPHKKSLEEGNINEERRLCYVGVTRGREKIIMTYCKEKILYGKKIPRQKSRFILPHSSLYQEQDRTTFGNMTKDEVHQYQNQFIGNLLGLLD